MRRTTYPSSTSSRTARRASRCSRPSTTGYERSIPEAQAIMPQLSRHAHRAGVPAPGPEPPDRPDLGALAGRPHRLPVHPDHRRRTRSPRSSTTSWPTASRCSRWASSPTATSSPTSPRSRIKEGHQAAQIVADWMAKTGTTSTTFAVSGGDPTQNWAQGRMQGFIDGITELVPGATFVNDAAVGAVDELRPGGHLRRVQGLPPGQPRGPVHRERGHRRRAR